MNNLNYGKMALLRGSFVTAVLLIGSTGYCQESDNSRDIAEEGCDVRLYVAELEKDADFLVNAAEIDLAQIQCAKLAQQKGSASHIIELGETMEEAHTKSLNELLMLSESNSISIPTSACEDSLSAFNRLNEESEADFDKAYADWMIRVHHDAIKTYEVASTDCSNAEIRSWAGESLPALRANLGHSVKSQKKFDTIYLKYLDE